MEEWVTVDTVFTFEEQARKAAQVIRVTESRLLSSARGVQYDLETEVTEVSGGWQVRWRKILLETGSGCGGCSSCQSESTHAKRKSQPGKVIQFRPRQDQEGNQ